MLVITGTGRSGTSCLAEFCKQMGFDPGGGWNARINAGYECGEVVGVNRILSYDDFDESIRNRILAIDRTVVKDPRFIWKHVINYWLEVRDDLTFVIMERDIQSVADSRYQDSGLLVHYKYRGELVEKEEFIPKKQKELEDFKALLDNKEATYRILQFPDCLTDYDSVYKALTECGLSFDYKVGNTTWESIADLSKVHHAGN